MLGNSKPEYFHETVPQFVVAKNYVISKSWVFIFAKIVKKEFV